MHVVFIDAVSFNGTVFGPANSEYLMYYTEMECTGHESSLLSCSYQMTNSTVCPHGKDAGVRCTSGLCK